MSAAATTPERPALSEAVVSAPESTAQEERVVSLDAYRGLIMLTLLAGSIFRSLKGDPVWGWLARQNEHVAWRGCTYWDLIQPSFMFMVGVAMPFALAKRAARGDTWGQRFRHVAIRAFNLIAIGIILDNFAAQEFNIGFIRVLQQIAFGYFFAFFLVGKPFRVQALAAGAILVGYNLLWMFNPWNGPGGPWAIGNQNIGSAFDFWLLGRHYNGYYVGMNAIPSTVTILFGVMAGQLIMERRPAGQTMRILLIAGIAGIALGLAVSPWLPLIKRIWTPSFTVFAGGCTALMLLFFYWVIEVKGRKNWAFPLVVVGMNSIAAYVIGNIFGGWFKDLSKHWIGWLQIPLGTNWYPVFERSLFTLFAWCILYWLYKRRIFFKA